MNKLKNLQVYEYDHDYKVRCFCEHAGIDNMPLTAMSVGLYAWWREWSTNRIVRSNGMLIDPATWIGTESTLRIGPHGVLI